MKRIRVYVSGMVQDVGFRSFVRKRAVESGVKGFVMNLSDGRVLLVVEGGDEQIEKFMACISECPTAAIKNLKVSEEEYKNEFNDFKIL